MLAVVFTVLLPSDSGFLRRMGFQDHAKPSPVFNVKEFAASGSDQESLGSISGGETKLKLDVILDFKNGEGIKIEHAGTACLLKGRPCPIAPKPIVIVQGAGATTYTYQLAVIDEGGGIGPAGPAVTITNGPSVLSTQLYNIVRWEPVREASGYALYRNDHLITVLSGLTPEGYYQPPRGPAFTSFFKDMGLLAEKNHYPDIPLAPPKTALADALITTIISGAGSTFLEVREKALSSVRRVVVIHDDSAAIQATLDAAGTGATVYFPIGSYLFTRLGFSIRQSHLKLTGSGNQTALLRDNLVGNSFPPVGGTEPCGFLTPIDFSDVEISSLALYGLAPFGSSMTRRKKAICATGSFDRFYVHDVVAQSVSGEAIYADDVKPGEVIFSSNTVENCSKNALNTNSAVLANVTVTDNVVKKVSGAAILVVSQNALVARNKITGGAPIGTDVVNVAVGKFFTIAANEITGLDTSLAATSLVHVGFHGSGLYGSGVVVGNLLKGNQTLNETVGGAIFIDDVSSPVLIENNVIEKNASCCSSEGPAISIANKVDKVLIVGNTIRGSETYQDIGVRVEKSVPTNNHIIIKDNDIGTSQRFLFDVTPNGGSESEFAVLLQTAKSWTSVKSK